jgi:vacuolar-type H+-ATPase subunit F/Vma7
VGSPSDSRATVAAIGAPALVRGFALAGALVLPAEQPADVRQAWRSVPDEVGLVVLTEPAAQALTDELGPQRTWPLVAVMS